MNAMEYQATEDRLKRAIAENDQAWLAANYPGAWPWPVSGGMAKPEIGRAHV